VRAASGLIGTAENVIDKAATTSSLSDQPHEVRCGGATPGDNPRQVAWRAGALPGRAMHHT